VVALSIVIPTIAGREHWLEHTLAEYKRTLLYTGYETIIVRDHAVCGTAWNEGIEQAKGRYVLLGADDLTPLPGFFRFGMDRSDAGQLPSALIYNPDGTIQSCGDVTMLAREGTEATIARVPFATREMMEAIYPIIETHYFTDNWFSHQGRLNGWPSIVTHGFAFVHHFAPEGRIDNEDQVRRDQLAFAAAARLERVPTPAAL
jgi:hypothetical protein